GSAGAKALDALGITYTACDDQAKALMEVAAGSTQAFSVTSRVNPIQRAITQLVYNIKFVNILSSV
ncbi:MAG: hypothetical protein IKA57_06545, partial [Clostridia bacterium]|nr:hypothetical protein [Clostridia bacterium]